jgi:hypothetical protein
VTNTAKPFTLTKDSFAFPQLNDLGESVELPEINMGHAGPRLCSPKAFRTPETILARPFNEQIDVWMVGWFTSIASVSVRSFPLWCPWLCSHPQPEQSCAHQALRSRHMPGAL